MSGSYRRGMRRSAVIGWVALAILGLAVAAAVSLAASQLSSQRIGLASEPLTAGNRLAPRTSTATTPASTQTAAVDHAVEHADDDRDDDHRQQRPWPWPWPWRRRPRLGRRLAVRPRAGTAGTGR